MLKAEIKKARPKQTVEAKPRATAPTREGLGLFSRAEEAVANMDIPKEGISADALMARLRDDPDVPNDEIDFGLALMTQPNTKITRDMLDDLFANTFGVKETRLRGDDTEYAEYAQYRLPDEPGSAYTETVFQARLVDGQPSWVSDEHFEDFAENQIGHMRTSIRNTDDGKRVLVIEEIQADAYKADKGAVKDKEVPFKNKAGYTNMILARAMRTAAEQDLDGVMVLNAAEQIKRNTDSFTDVVDKMTSYTESLPDGSTLELKRVALTMKDGSIKNLIVNRDGKVVQAAFDERFEGMKLSDVIGSKKTAQDLLDKDQEISGADRVIGKSGYKTVYDNRIPKRLNDIVKRMDADGTVDKGTLKVSEIDSYQDINADTFMDAIDMDGREFVDKIVYGLADDTPEGHIHTKIMKDAHERYDDAFRNEFFEFTDEENPYPYNGMDTLDELLQDGWVQLRGSGRNRNAYAQEIFLMYGDRFNELGDAEDWLDDYLDHYYHDTKGPLAYLKRQLQKKQESSGDNIRTIENNTRVLFTPEMKAEILGRGLPRLRTGGLVGKK